MLEENFFKKCTDWLGFEVNPSKILTISKEDDGSWHRRIYLAVWNDDDGYTHTYILRVFTSDDGNHIDLSQDYEAHVPISDFVNWLPTIVKEIQRIS